MSKPNQIIVITGGTEFPEAFSNFKKACEKKGHPYHTLKKEKFPIVSNEQTIHKIDLQ